MALEKRNEYVSKYGENAKWVVKQSQIDDIKDNFINSANDVIKRLNSNIKINNTVINNPPGWNTQSEIDEAVKNNKKIIYVASKEGQSDETGEITVQNVAATLALDDTNYETKATNYENRDVDALDHPSVVFERQFQRHLVVG